MQKTTFSIPKMDCTAEEQLIRCVRGQCGDGNDDHERCFGLAAEDDVADHFRERDDNKRSLSYCT